MGCLKRHSLACHTWAPPTPSPHCEAAAPDMKNSPCPLFTGCYRLVDYLEGIQKNFDEAAKVLKFNCEENQHSDSCYKLGAYYVTGKGKDKEGLLFGSLSLIAVLASHLSPMMSSCRRVSQALGKCIVGRWRGRSSAERCGEEHSLSS